MLRDNIKGERCVLCGAGATVRVRGTSLCASCGLEQHPPGPTDVESEQSSPSSAAGSGFSAGSLVKMLLGAVAVAVIVGFAATTIRTEPVAPADGTPAASVSTPSTSSSTEAVASPIAVANSATTAAPSPWLVDSGGDEPPAHRFAAAVQAWADCVLHAAATHPGGVFEPSAACPDKPEPGDFGLGGVGGTTPPGDGGPGS